jgi:hypothetical protein
MTDFASALAVRIQHLTIGVPWCIISTPQPLAVDRQIHSISAGSGRCARSRLRCTDNRDAGAQATHARPLHDTVHASQLGPGLAVSGSGRTGLHVARLPAHGLYGRTDRKWLVRARNRISSWIHLEACGTYAADRTDPRQGRQMHLPAVTGQAARAPLLPGNRRGPSA